MRMVCLKQIILLKVLHWNGIVFSHTCVVEKDLVNLDDDSIYATSYFERSSAKGHFLVKDVSGSSFKFCFFGRGWFQQLWVLCFRGLFRHIYRQGPTNQYHEANQPISWSQPTNIEVSEGYRYYQPTNIMKCRKLFNTADCSKSWSLVEWRLDHCKYVARSLNDYGAQRRGVSLDRHRHSIVYFHLWPCSDILVGQSFWDHVSHEKTLGWLFDIGNDIITSFIGIIRNHDKDPY